jgi:hypothetical protein
VSAGWDLGRSLRRLPGNISDIELKARDHPEWDG